MRIVKYTPEYQTHFERLNRAWIEQFFEMEPLDEVLLLHPEKTIVNKGGQIYFVEHQDQIIGTVALILVEKGIYEMAKMAVDERFQGLGAGKLLCQTAIDAAKALGADKLILFTNSKLKTAIALYHQSGFKDLNPEGQEYSRADTKMELLLACDIPKWFERQFGFDFGMEMFPELLERLESNIIKIREAIQDTAEVLLNYKPAGKWSIKEHIGHLWILEPLWLKRFEEIKSKTIEMSPADLNNTATDIALFNQCNIEKILSDFQQERALTIQQLKQYKGEDFKQSLHHPRLNQPMRIIDLMYFVAEHDEHHLNHIFKIQNSPSHG
jgi:N-acetylglutamate synthase-like GNAT family acetyltransferase/uncharacterized damage-inducible protein DinB